MVASTGARAIQWDGDAGEGREHSLQRGSVLSSSFRARRFVEEINHAALQRIFGAQHEQPLVRNQFFKDLRPVPQVTDRGADVGADRLLHERIGVMSESWRQQSLN